MTKLTDMMRFDELVEINPRVKLDDGRTYPFVEMGAINPTRRYVEVTEVRSFKGGGTKFLAGDTLFARITPCLENGKIAQFHAPAGTTAFGSTEFFVFRNRPGVSDPGYVYYLATSDLIRKPAEKSMSGASGRQRADVKSITNLLMAGPPLPTQQRIAGVLSAYDDLIENNLRRIKLLEEMARTLYREWFVEFRFPGYKKVTMIDSPIGKIPERWELEHLRKCIEINPRIIVSREGEKPFVLMGGLTSDSMLITGVEARSGNSGTKFQNGDTLFARITPCLENGKTGFVQFLSDARAVGLGSTEFIVLRSRMLSPEFVYFLARSEKFRSNAIKSMSGASGRQRVQEQCFDRFLLTKPPRALLDQFSAIVSPNFRLIHRLYLQTQDLNRTRDLLLPKLISGELDVSKLGIAVPAEVA